MKFNVRIYLLLFLSILMLNSCSIFDPIDNSPPVFNGAKALTLFDPGFPHIPENVYFHLTWEAATDNVTPQGRIVYLIYKNTGPVNYGTPSSMTDPGVLSADVFTDMFEDTNFAVRARDEAGNIDTNTVILTFIGTSSL